MSIEEFEYQLKSSLVNDIRKTDIDNVYIVGSEWMDFLGNKIVDQVRLYVNNAKFDYYWEVFDLLGLSKFLFTKQINVEIVIGKDWIILALVNTHLVDNQ